MTKICHITSAHYSTDERIFYKECITLAKAGYETYIVAKGESFECDGVHIIGIGEQRGGRYYRIFRFSNEIYKAALKVDADIYHLHDPELLPYCAKLKKKGKKIIFDSHEDITELLKFKKWILSTLRAIISPFYYYYQNKCLKACDAIVSVTPHICEKIEKINKNTVMITNYPILKVEGFLNELHKKQSNLICFTGGVNDQWSHKYIIKAISTIPDVEYIIYGRKQEGYLESLAGIDGFDKVKYAGVIPHTDVFNEMQKASVGMAICQYSDNMGGIKGSLGNTKIFEYMQAGLPLVCTDFEIWKQIVNDYHCGICVNPTNVEEITEAIKYMLDFPKEALQMGENGRKAVLDKYNWSNEESKLLKLYKLLLKDNVK